MEELASSVAAFIHVAVFQVTVVIAVKQVGYYQEFLSQYLTALTFTQEASI